MDEEKIEVTLTISLLSWVDQVAELVGFSTREEVVVSAVRRFLDRFFGD